MPTSTTTTPSANAQPWVRSALVPPALPLPCVRMSTPRSGAEQQAADHRPEQVSDEGLETEFEHVASSPRDAAILASGPARSRGQCGRNTSASMQRTDPPPSVSIVGIGAATIRSTVAARRSIAAGPNECVRGRGHRQHAARIRRAQFEHVAREAGHLRGIDDLDVPAGGARGSPGRARGRAASMAPAATTRAARADGQHHVGVIDRHARGVGGRERARRVAEFVAEFGQAARDGCAATGRRTRCVARDRRRCCPCPRGTGRATRAASGRAGASTVRPCSAASDAINSRRRSSRRLGASIGYSTTVPSACRLTQLFGKMASGHTGACGVGGDGHCDARRRAAAARGHRTLRRRAGSRRRPGRARHAGSDCWPASADSSRSWRAAPSARHRPPVRPPSDGLAVACSGRSAGIVPVRLSGRPRERAPSGDCGRRRRRRPPARA